MQWISEKLDAWDHALCMLGLWQPASWENVRSGEVRHLYAGTLSHGDRDFSFRYGLRLHRPSRRNLVHDIRAPMPIPDNSVESYLAEDVLEYAPYEETSAIFDEIFRVLKPCGHFRMSVPDFRYPAYSARSVVADDGSVLFDPVGGGRFVDGNVVGGGILWFPVYETVKAAFDKSLFAKKGSVEFLHYTMADGTSVLKEIDYARGLIRRTPDFDERAQNPRCALSIVVDAIKL